MYNVSGNKELPGLGGTEAAQRLDQRQRASASQRGQQQPNTTDFYVPGAPSLDQNQSVLSNDLLYLNEPPPSRPDGRIGKKSQKDIKAQPDGSQLRKVYGNVNELSGMDLKKKRSNMSPHQSAFAGRPESS